MNAMCRCSDATCILKLPPTTQVHTAPEEDVQYVVKVFEKDERLVEIFQNVMFPPPKPSAVIMEKLPDVLNDIRPYDPTVRSAE